MTMLNNHRLCLLQSLSIFISKPHATPFPSSGVASKYHQQTSHYYSRDSNSQFSFHSLSSHTLIVIYSFNRFRETDNNPNERSEWKSFSEGKSRKIGWLFEFNRMEKQSKERKEMELFGFAFIVWAMKFASKRLSFSCPSSRMFFCFFHFYSGSAKCWFNIRLATSGFVQVREINNNL